MTFEKKMTKTLLDKVRGRLTIGTVAAGLLLFMMFLAVESVSAATFKTVDGEVVVEAEQYTRRGGSVGGSWFKSTKRSGYTGSGYMQSGNSKVSSLKFSKNLTRVEYDINFQQTGTYYLHLRTRAENHAENGFFATLDGKQFNYGSSYYVYVYPLAKNPRWHWYTSGNRGRCVSIKVSSKGTRTLAIYRRDGNQRLDRFWLTKHNNHPQDTGSLNLKSPSLFLGSGSSSSSSSGSSSSGSSSSGSSSSSSGDCTLASKFDTTRMIIGANYYTDRDYIITGSVPSWMLGRTLIQTPNDEKKNRSSSGYLTFTAPVSHWVYVLFDSRSNSIPNWLKSDGWSRYTKYDNIDTSLDTQPSFKMYRKMFDSGDCVDLGGNYGPGSSSEYRSNYAVVYGK